MAASTFECRACNSRKFETLLDMGDMPLANAFISSLDDTDDQRRWPLSLVMCLDCSLMQIRHEVDRELLFRNYLWMTSTSASAKQHAVWTADRLWQRHGNDCDGAPFLVEVASNDGFFLEHFRDVGFEILGVDPSNFAEDADRRGLPSIRDFFGAKIARQIIDCRGKPKVIIARNVLGHSSELQDLIVGMEMLMAADSVLILEMPYAFLLNHETQYDTIFHEHLSYLTVGSTHNMFARLGLKITDITFVDMNGGSILCELRRENHAEEAKDQALLDLESMLRLNEPRGWRHFADNVARQKQELVDLLVKLTGEGNTILAYGAAAKFMTMLSYCDIREDLVGVVADANPLKQGLYCPGVRIPVVSPADLISWEPDYVLIGAWNFRDEIIGFLRSEFGYRGKFIIPLPLPYLVD